MFIVEILPDIGRIERDESANRWHISVDFSLDLSGNLIVKVDEPREVETSVLPNQIEEIEASVRGAREALALQMALGVRVGPKEVVGDRAERCKDGRVCVAHGELLRFDEAQLALASRVDLKYVKVH